MKGLFIKDLCLSKQLLKLVVIMGLISVVILIGDPTKIDFVAGYLIIISSTFAISTISYDDYNNDMTFLMTLPIKRKDYVYEKYIYGAASIALGLVSFFLLAVVLFTIRRIPLDFLDMCTNMLAMLGMGSLMISFTLPIQLKFGTEKGRLIIIIVLFILFLAILGAANFSDQLPAFILQALTALFFQKWSWILIAAMILLTFIISVRISVGVIEKKEY